MHDMCYFGALGILVPRPARLFVNQTAVLPPILAAMGPKCVEIPPWETAYGDHVTIKMGESAAASPFR